MMRELSAQPGFNESLIASIDKGGKKGPALLTPKLVDELRKRVLGKDWQGLDRFPGWSMHEINPAVRVAGETVGKSEAVSDLAAAHPDTHQGAPPVQAHTFLDLGPYVLDKPATLSLNTPSTLPGFTTEGIVTDLGHGVTRGDGPNELAAEHAQSQRLADALNRLAANKLDGTAEFVVTVSDSYVVEEARTPQDLIAALQANGHTVNVTDTRYFANFAHLHYKGQDVMAPFWVNTQIVFPHSKGRKLVIPVSHAEYEWHIRGPVVNADVSYYFGIDGKSQWRTMDTQDQAWVMKRNAHLYKSTQAVEVTRLAGLLTVAYMHLHAAHPALPFGGYYALGVCQDGVSAIEKKMTSRVTLFPNTADASLFTDSSDAEINGLIAAIPKDRGGVPPTPERVFGSVPTDDYNAITIPGLAADLNAAHLAWTNGTLVPGKKKSHKLLIVGVLIAIAVIGVSFNRRRNIDDF
jgi:hypothetical protein